jgi:hypothetical protein
MSTTTNTETNIPLTQRGTAWRTDARGVVELHPADPAATVCGDCGRGWDDRVPTAWTPTPSGRCPFEDQHDPPNIPLTREVRQWPLGREDFVHEGSVCKRLVHAVSPEVTIQADLWEHNDNWGHRQSLHANIHARSTTKVAIQDLRPRSHDTIVIKLGEEAAVYISIDQARTIALAILNAVEPF